MSTVGRIPRTSCLSQPTWIIALLCALCRLDHCKSIYNQPFVYAADFHDRDDDPELAASL